jgi:hypothetical protein
MNATAIGALVAQLPLAAAAETSAVMYVPRSDRMIQHLYVHTGTTVDVALPPGESLTSNPIIGDPRWRMVTFASGNLVHIALKPSDALPTEQLVTIPASKQTLHLLIRAGANESTTYTLRFFEAAPRPVAPARPAPAPSPAPSSKPAAPSEVRVAACAPPLDTHYAVMGDTHIDVRAACDDGHHNDDVGRRDVRAMQQTPQFVDDPRARSRHRTRLAQTIAGSIVRTGARHRRDRRLNLRPCRRPVFEPGIEEHRRRARSGANQVEPKAADIDQSLRREVEQVGLARGSGRQRADELDRAQ